MLLDTWHFFNTDESHSVIMPDGCRDLIFSQSESRMPQWHVSPLFDQATRIITKKHTYTQGFRLKPGTKINESGLLYCLKNKDITSDISSHIHDFTSINGRITEIFECLFTECTSIQKSAKHLGVNLRTLQRLVLKETNRTPKYWMMLARARKAAKLICSNKNNSYAAIANICHYSDQAHLCRDIQHWFGATASQVRSSPDIANQFKNITDY